MNIDDARKEIDAIDASIVKVLDRRAKIVKGIGVTKARAGLPIFDRRRESEVLRGVHKSSDGSFGSAPMERIFSEILLESRRIQRLAVPSRERQAEDIR
jgi:chorismate mutase